ncbi:hybrid sensor histidine kinase/response regulator [Frateuria hangzhouensis]|uniref:hybrid sensor histidine kinase/response regulator n=1 Tax=Frateuria hangzhouensis TaxID=2995589 RepID=UPI002260E791|nr:PAS domain-containing sensor histidine kinase [Frateuria sp. STR12]MCX7513271.1 PAS domain S-box protein [Frateuria sp. STR12]
METSATNAYQLLVQSIRDYAIFMVDRQGRIRSWNAGAEQIHGHRAADIVGRAFALLHTEEERHGGRPELILHMAAAHGRFQEEAERLRRDGSRFWAHVVCDAMRDEHGSLLGFAMVTRDITERRLTETQLREVDRRFRLFVDGVTDCAICMLDANGIVTDWNTGAERIKGYTASEIIGRPLSQFFVNPLVAQTAMTVASEAGRYDVVDWQVRKDGSRFMAEIAVDAIRDNDGRLLGFAKITRDITERVDAERHLEDTRAQLFQSQKIEALGQLTGGMAHDFNNLLQGIIGSLEVVEMRLAAGRQDVDRFLGNALESAKRAATLTHRLLAFARRQPLAPRSVNLNDLVAQIAELLPATLGERVELKLDLAPSLLPVMCDPNLLESAILNLSINARDAMPEGGRLTIRTASVPPGEGPLHRPHSLRDAPTLLLQVSDTGVGMSADVRARAFDPFFTTKPKGRGTGLGLSMIHGFVSQSRGAIELDSEPGRGTTVSVYLPSGERRSMRALDDRNPGRDWEPAAGETILLVEDEDVVRDLIAGKLRELGYRVMEARDGHAGLSRIESAEHIDMVVSDIGLPGLTGLQMIEIGRHHRPDLKVLFVTGYAETMPEDWTLDANTDLLTKPFEFDTLVQRMRTLLPTPLERAQIP